MPDALGKAMVTDGEWEISDGDPELMQIHDGTATLTFKKPVVWDRREQTFMMERDINTAVWLDMLQDRERRIGVSLWYTAVHKVTGERRSVRCVYPVMSVSSGVVLNDAVFSAHRTIRDYDGSLMPNVPSRGVYGYVDVMTLGTQPELMQEALSSDNNQ